MEASLVIKNTFRRLIPSEGKDRTFAHCICCCGKEFDTLLKSIKTGNTRSCGCRRKKTLKKMLTTHGEISDDGQPSKELAVYYGIKKRCSNPKDKSYHLYGGRGIECRFVSFSEFLECLGRRPSSQHSVDRIDPNGHYEPGNVRWATLIEQANNTRNTVRIEINGVKRTLLEWCNIYDIPRYQFFNRRRMGLSIEEIFSKERYVRPKCD